MYRNGGHIIGELFPVLSPIQSNKETKLCTEKQQIWVYVIFLNIADKSVNVICNDVLPCFTEICGFIGVRFHIIVRVPFKNGIGSCLIKTTCLNMVAPGIFGQTNNVFYRICPCFSSILSDLNITVISTYPKNIGI